MNKVRLDCKVNRGLSVIRDRKDLSVSKGRRGTWVQPARRVNKVRLVTRVLKGWWVSWDFKDLSENKELPACKAQWETKGQSDCKASKGPPVIRGCKALRVIRAQLVSKVPSDHKAPWEMQGRKAQLERKDWRACRGQSASKGPWVMKDRKDPRAYKGQWANRALRAIRARLVSRDPLETKGRKANRAPWVIKDQLVPRDHWRAATRS